MRAKSRRCFLAEVGRGMLVAGVGLGTAIDLGLASARCAEPADELSFGPREPLVRLLQETPAERLLPQLVARLAQGTPLAELVAAAALANARTFGGEDYTGFHTLMALPPSLQMADLLPLAERPLPVLKVLYRNTARIQEQAGRDHEVLHPVAPGPSPSGDAGRALHEAVLSRNVDQAEQTFAALASGELDEMFNSLLFAVHDHSEVHRIVLPYRAWELVSLVGREQAHTLLRQSLRYCVQNERGNSGQLRALLPKLFDQHKLAGRSLGTRQVDDAWVDSMWQTLLGGTPEQAADAAAAALAEGIAPDAIGEAITVAANELVLRDHGREARYASAAKPPGSVHGDSIGVHASDAVNAYRNLVPASNPRNAMAGLILAAHWTAAGRVWLHQSPSFAGGKPYPHAEHLEKTRPADAPTLLSQAEEAIRGQDQGRACAVVSRYAEQNHAPEDLVKLLVRFAVSEDGALHAEKYFRTVQQEFGRARAAFRWRHLIALARVTASEYGRPAPGLAQARELLNL